MVSQDTVNVLVIWRDKHLTVEVNANSKVLEFGRKLQKLTDVNSDTLRLLVPQSKSKSARLISPFSDEHKNLSLLEASILEGKPVRMMGAFDDEVKEVSEASSKSDQRILGFDEEEKRLWLRTSSSPQVSLKLPQGAYIFCDFRTLQLPGIELNPPPSEALRRMHMLACDPGIIAIMNKHRWRVGIMTEMAPEGYVGISPECILGFNRNHGEEISLRLRTDDLKGFRKYESIKKTLLHELAHMVFSEHDGNFYALDKQLNQEAANLDWTKSRSHTLMSGHKGSNFYEADLDLGANSAEIGQKLGGTSNPLANARVTSVAAAYNHILKSSPKETSPSSKTHLSGADEPDPDDRELSEVQQRTISEPDPDDTLMSETYSEPSMELSIGAEEPDPDDFLDNNMMCEPDPDDCEPDPDDCLDNKRMREPDPDDSEIGIVDANFGNMVEPDPDDDESASNVTAQKLVEPDPDECDKVIRSSNNLESDETERAEPDPDDHPDELNTEVLKRIEEPVALANARVTSVAAAYNSILKLSPKETSPSSKTHLSGADEPDPDDSELNEVQQRTIAEPDPDDTLITETYSEPSMELSVGAEEPDPDDFFDNMMCEPDPDDCEPDPDDCLDNKRMREPEPDDSEIGMVDANCRNMVEPDPDDDESASNVTAQKLVEPDPDECDKVIRSSNNLEADEIERAQPDSDDHPDELNFEVLKRIEEPVAAFCSRIQSAIKKIRAELTPAEADSVLQTLYKIIRNVIEHPEEVKFRRLRKSNPHFQRSVVKYKAAVDVLTIVGFGEEVISDTSGRGDIYLILKRNDPGLLWLAKSSVEVSMA